MQAESFSPQPMMGRVIAFLVSLAIFAFLSVALTPNREKRPDLPPKSFERIVPKSFDGWRVDETVVPILPQPEVIEKVNNIYDETMARTYIDDSGRRVMLSIAYGGDQTGRLRVHRPESCYSGQGFQVKSLAEETLDISGRQVPVKRLFAELGARREPITYWIRVGDQAVTGLIGQRLTQLKYGLTGEVPDGLIFRVSSIDRNPSDAFALQDRFVAALIKSISAGDRDVLIGPAPVGRDG